MSDEQAEKLAKILTDKIDEANQVFLKKMGEHIKRIKSLTPTQAHQLIQTLRYGDSYDEIVKEISKITNMNVKSIDKIFAEFAKEDQRFAEQFYKYRGKPFIKFEENMTLQKTVNSLAEISKNTMKSFSRTSAIGYSIKDPSGKIIKMKLRDAYDYILDEAFLNISQGKMTFDEEMRRIMKGFGNSGLKYLEYMDGRSIRLDSMVRQHLRGALRDLHNQTWLQYGKEFDSDGVEISVHANPAPDHAEVQGKQFSTVKPSEDEMSEFEKFQNDEEAKTYDGEVFPPEHEGRDRRSIGEYNCYHYIFPIILGVSKPVHSKEELKEIIKQNNDGFEINGEHFTNYQGTQLMRKIETEIRKQKDIQIFARASGDNELVDEAQKKITMLTKDYKEILEASGLSSELNRARVSGYRRVALK